MVKKILALALLAVLGVAAPARAAFTQKERPSAVAAYEGARYFSWAEYWAGAAIQAAHTTASRDEVADLVANLSRAERGVGLVAFTLSGWYGNPVNKTREEQLVQFRFQLRRTLDDTLPAALLALRKAREVKGEAAAYYEALATVDQLLRYEADPRLQQVDPDLPYLDPTPQELLPGQTVAAFIKPHGDYYRGVRHANDGANYASDAVDEGWLPFYLALRTSPVKWGQYLGGLYRSRAYGLVQGYKAAQDAYGLSPLDDPHTEQREGPADRFCQVLDAGKQLTNARDGAAGESVAETLVNLSGAWGKLAHAVAEETHPATRKALAAALERGSVRFADWWGNGVDGASWSLFRFENEPQKSRCRLVFEPVSAVR